MGLTGCVESIGSGVSEIESVATELGVSFRHRSPLNAPNRTIQLVQDQPLPPLSCGAISFSIGALASSQMDSKKHDLKNVDDQNV